MIAGVGSTACMPGQHAIVVVLRTFRLVQLELFQLFEFSVPGSAHGGRCRHVNVQIFAVRESFNSSVQHGLNLTGPGLRKPPRFLAPRPVTLF